MANWPSNPSWTSEKQINSGRLFNPADGVRARDMNAIVKNLIYLNGRKVEVVDEITRGDLRPVSSNAVALVLGDLSIVLSNM